MHRNYQDVAENIELIRLQQDKKSKATVLTTMKAQIQALEEEVVKYKTDIDKLRAENSDLSTNLSEEQRKAINLAGELSNNSRLQLIPLKKKFEFYVHFEIDFFFIQICNTNYFSNCVISLIINWLPRKLSKY